MSKKASKEKIDEQVQRVWMRCPTYGQLEAAAGVTDRIEFWHNKSEEQARVALRTMIEARIRSGHLNPASI